MSGAYGPDTLLGAMRLCIGEIEAATQVALLKIENAVGRASMHSEPLLDAAGAVIGTGYSSAKIVMNPAEACRPRAAGAAAGTEQATSVTFARAQEIAEVLHMQIGPEAVAIVQALVELIVATVSEDK